MNKLFRNIAVLIENIGEDYPNETLGVVLGAALLTVIYFGEHSFRLFIVALIATPTVFALRFFTNKDILINAFFVLFAYFVFIIGTLFFYELCHKNPYSILVIMGLLITSDCIKEYKLNGEEECKKYLKTFIFSLLVLFLCSTFIFSGETALQYSATFMSPALIIVVPYLYQEAE